MHTTLTPYLAFPDTTRDAFELYAAALGAEIRRMMTFADMPAPPASPASPASPTAPADDGRGVAPSGDGVMHARLVLPGGAMPFAGDAPPGLPYEGIKGNMLSRCSMRRPRCRGRPTPYRRMRRARPLP